MTDPAAHTPEPQTTVDPDDDSAGPPSSLWAQMKSDPQYAPEHLALEVVRHLLRLLDVMEAPA